MLIATRLGVLLTSSLLLVASGMGQQEIPATTASAMTPAAQGRDHRIVLDVVVTPKSGKPVAGLAQPAFTVLDNKVARPLTSFRAVGSGQEPIEVVILVDAVNVDYTRVSYERQEIEKFLKADGGHLAHPTSLAIFGDTGVQMQQGFSTDGNALSADLDQYTIGLRTIRRSAGFYGASDRFDLSMKALRDLTQREAARPGRKLLLWVSPGWPLLSGPAVELDRKQQDGIFSEIVMLSNELRRGRITLYSVDPLGAGESVLRSTYYEEYVKGIKKSSQTDLGDLGLQVLAVQSGGMVLNGNNDIAGQLKKALDDTTAYYEMSFDAAPADKENEYHTIQVQVADPGLTARTRMGYYAQP